MRAYGIAEGIICNFLGYPTMERNIFLKNVYMYITKSLHYTAEINTTL